MDPNRQQLIRVAAALGDLLDDVVFIGGSVVGLLVTDPAAPAPRPTDDVDVIVEVASYVDYQQQLAPRLRKAGFRECMDEDAPICRWVVAKTLVDVMPTDTTVLGFGENRWYQAALEAAAPIQLGVLSLRVITAPYFMATKFAAFESPTRENAGDHLASHDLEDIITLVDGRPEVVDDCIAVKTMHVGTYLDKRIEALVDHPDFSTVLEGALEDRRAAIVKNRFLTILLPKLLKV